MVDAASTKPFGFNAFYPGPGLGGIVYLLTHSTYLGRPRNMDITLNLLSFLGNKQEMPKYILEKTAYVLNESKSINDSKY